MEANKVGDVEFDGADAIHDAAQPFAAGGGPFHAPSTETILAPSCCGRSSSSLFWHPTHAVLTDKATGRQYLWDSRSHRKLRFLVAVTEKEEKHPRTFRERCRLVSWEPHIVTWYNCWISVIAKTMWVVNGLYSTWPDQAGAADPTLISYGTGVFGAFLFIVCGYLGFIEAINQTFFAPVELPVSGSSGRSMKGRSKYVRPLEVFGQNNSPIGFVNQGFHTAQLDRLLHSGYPVVEDVKTNHIIAAPLLDAILQRNQQETGFRSTADGKEKEESYQTTNEALLIGRTMRIHVGRHLIGVTVDSWDAVTEGKETQKKRRASYKWWAWKPDMTYLRICNAVVFFILTIIFFIPACAWWPMVEKGASSASTVFWVYVLQIVPCLGFIYYGLGAMAEASGSWIKPALNRFGWWASFFNFLGGIGFLLYAVLALPSTVNPDNPLCSCVRLTQYGADFATFWGSCFFWIAGILQCIEFSNKHPILL